MLRSADGAWELGYKGGSYAVSAMSEEQLSALLAKLKEDAGLLEKLKSAADLDAAVEIAKEAGFDVSKADWLRHQAEQTMELSDGELEGVSGGKSSCGGGRHFCTNMWGGGCDTAADKGC